jgi:hypothetical protein
MIEFLGDKEKLTCLKLMLIKIAAMLNEDEVYSKDMAFNDVMKIIQKIELFDKPILDIMTDSIL